jgi:hypothetical protein
MNGPIERYLAELRTTLRFDTRTTQAILRETKDHLVCSSRALTKTGSSDAEAQAEAVARFGPVDDLIQRFEREGGPLVTRDWKSSPVIPAVFILPASLFVVANLMAFHVFSNRFLYENVINPVLDRPWSAIPANLIITLGPLIALILSGSQIVRFAPATDGAAHREAVIQLNWGHLSVLLVSFCLAAVLGGYLLFENLPHL